MSDAVIVKIDLATSHDDYIKRHLTKQSEETKERIQKVIEEKKIVQKAQDSLKEKTRQKTQGVNNLFTELYKAGEHGLTKEYIIAEMTKIGAAKSSSGVTLKLKAMVKSELVGYELEATKTHYFIKPVSTGN